MTWPWIFYINIPVGLMAAYATWVIYRERETPTKLLPIDRIGLALLVIWVGSMQLMLDKGKELDWFHSTEIVVLTLVAVVGFLFFLIWESYEKHPIVDISLFKGRNFSAGVVAISVAYGLFFGSLVILPLWLQTIVGYTATDAGIVMAPVGIFAILLSPVIGRNLPRMDARWVATTAFITFGIVSLMRAGFTTQVDTRTLMIPTLMGRGDGDVLHPADLDHPVGPAAREDPRRLGPVELRADHLRRDRRVDLDDGMGEPLGAAPRAAGGEGQPL